MAQTIARAGCSAIILGLVVASDVGAQAPPRARPSEPPAVQSWFGLGSTIGLSVADPDAGDLQRAGVVQPGGALVVEVEASGAGRRAGLAKGDLVLEFDGERVRSAQHFTRLVRETPAGRGVAALVARGTARRTLTVTPEARELPAPLSALPELGQEMGRGWHGLQRRFEDWWDDEGPRVPSRRIGAALLPLSEQLARYFGVRGGVLVASVDSGSPAAAAGLRAGDVITAINDRAVSTPADVLTRLREAEPERALTFTVTRDKSAVTLHVTPTADPPGRRQRTI